MQAEGAWWADVEPSMMPKEPTLSKIMKDFQEPYGDRRQEIVFIGIGMDREFIEKALDEALLTDEEFADYLARTGQGAKTGQGSDKRAKVG